MLKKLGQKGQSMTAYALLVAFAVVVGLGIYNGGIRETFRGAYAKMGAQLGEGSGDVADYRGMTVAELKEIDNYRRIAADQQSLTNLASKYLGLTKAELKAQKLVQDRVQDSDLTYSGSDLTKGALIFDYQIVSAGDEAGSAAQSKFINAVAGAANIADWMSGKYDNIKTSFNGNQLYFFSDGVLDYQNADIDYKQANICLRGTFTFDSQGRADSVHFKLTRAYNPTAGGKWIMQLVDGMDLVIEK